MTAGLEKNIVALNQQQLVREVEKLVREDSLTYLEAIMTVAKDIEPEVIAKLVKGALKDKLENECMNRNLLEKKYDTVKLM